jgi:hypothetical protein
MSVRRARRPRRGAAPTTTRDAGPNARVAAPPPTAPATVAPIKHLEDSPMQRSTKIVATLGPASPGPRSAPEDVLRRRERRADELLPWQGGRPHRAAQPGARDGARTRPRGRDHGRPAGPEDPHRQVRDGNRSSSRRATRSSSTPNARAGRPGTRRPRLQGTARRREARATSCCSTTGASCSTSCGRGPADPHGRAARRRAVRTTRASTGRAADSRRRR